MSWPEHDPRPIPVRPEACAWDQRPDEDTDAFLAFSAWLTHSSENPYPHTATTRRWAAQHRWRGRRAAYAQSLAASSARAAHETAAARGAKHAALLEDIRELAHEAVLRLDAKDLSPRDALAWAKVAIDLERLRAGEPGAITREDYGGSALEDLEDLDRALEQIERGRKRNG